MIIVYRLSIGLVRTLLPWITILILLIGTSYLVSTLDADSIWNAFKCVIWPIIEMFVPKKVVHHFKKYRPRQYPKHIRKLLTKKSAIWRTLKTTHSPELLTRYRCIADLCKLKIFKFDSEREQRLLNANNLGAFYNFINRKLCSKSGIAPLKDDKNTLLTNDVDKANLLNNYFHSVFNNDDGTLPPFPSRFESDNNNNKLSDITISPKIIFYIICIEHLESNKVKAACENSCECLFVRKS